MDSESMLMRLSSAGILEHAGDDGQLTFTETFQNDLEEQRREFNKHEGDFSERDLGDTVMESEFGDLYRTQPDTVREYAGFWTLCTVTKENLPDEPADRIVQIACLLDHMRRGFPPDEGTPKGFLSVYADRLPVLLPFQQRSIVYVWREECPPCDTMRERLEKALPNRPQDIALFSVYGPNEAELLYSEYSVEGGPTTLFVVNGRIDARLFGPHYKSVIDNEIKKLYELS